MKIAIPSEGQMLESPVCRSFGRTLYFIVADTDTEKFQVIDNKAVAEQGGAGIKAAQTIADSGAQAVVVFHCGQNAADVLKAANIQLWKAVPGTAAENIEKFRKGELGRLGEIHPGFHGGQ
jgi:predicted Fe-Mo cluster-binding NifX family protein